MLDASVILSSLLLATVAGVLYRRVNGACRDGVRVLLDGRPATPYLDALARCLRRCLDDSLLTSVSVGGLQQMELRYREHHDPYQTVTELLADISNKARSEGNVPFDALFKATYQLSYTLSIPLEQLRPCLNALIKAMQRAPSGQSIARVQMIDTGEPVNTKTMVPLNYGPRVVYPLGVITLDSEGKVLSRARVICS
jgi:hypothetical protein